ncbi:MAG TPA: helicase-exonuclease AddAB subunit AddA [Lachnospiraceae bacterium]|nr:helicase-exonuclease AddAB subunit AddA [Lachnospiraceae bacterium]
MSVLWTEDQKKVIDTRGHNLLVSAAAGSGKTAVLVERILSLITDPEHPVDVDRLLVTTFTKAAAGEMKERIGKALGERLQKEPDNEWLKKQETLVSRAQITTIHGFCLYVIRNYFHTIDLNPNFRIADEGEMRLLKQDTAEEILEEAFEENSPSFIRFAESYGSGNRGSGLAEMILTLYEYAVASPQPAVWLKGCAAMYDLKEGASWSDFPGADVLLEALRTVAEDCLGQIRAARRIASSPFGPAAYDEALQADELQLRALTDSPRIETFEERLLSLAWKRLPSKRAKSMADADEELCGRVKDIRDQVKEALKSLVKQYFQLPGELVMEHMRKTRENVETYVGLTLAFMERLEEKKRKKNILDFSDQEHLALRILTKEDENGMLAATEVADLFADYFEEIMVDEYQDSNRVQEAILDSICKSRQGKSNRFMVGDVKQSIYRFRQAEPGLFLDKYTRYQDGKEGMRIDLHQNFRSRVQVLEPVNEVFGRIMCRELGGIEYDDAAALKAGASYPENDACGAQILLLKQEEWEEYRQECGWTKQEAEAHMIAAGIRKMLEVDKLQIWDKGKQRPADLGDIVILLRTMSGWSETFVRVLQDEGIAASAQSREGYFKTMEVETLLAYLRVLDNPTQEIPLAAAMHGMLGGFSSEEMAKIKGAFPEDGYVRACERYRQEGPEEALKEKLCGFFARVNQYRSRAAYTSIHELLWQIVTETGYTDEVRALPGGEQRAANVQMLLQKAQDYEKISYHGLFHFVRYIEKLQKYQVDFGEADLSDGGGEAVRIMSIHHSKGLEFPVVFVAGMGKSFNRQDSRSKVVLHNTYGIGLDYVDLEERMKRPVLLKQMIRRQNLLDHLGEELRVLYVAMTRAKEKLILTGMAKEKLLQEEGAEENEKLMFLSLSGAGCALEWILKGMDARSRSLTKTVVSLKEILTCAVQEETKNALSRDELERMVWYGKRDENVSGRIEEKLSWKYPYDLSGKTKQKYTVTELKKLRMQDASDAAEELYPAADPEIVPLIPQFIESTKEMTGAARGTVYHTVMECMDFSGITRLPQVEDRLSRLEASGRLTKEELKSINRKDLLTFAKSSLSERMQRAKEEGHLFKEQPFVIGLPGVEAGCPETEEPVLIQGIIDAFFYEGDEVVVVDYKTDRVSSPEELKDRYRTQLVYYEKALRMLTGKKVKERIIYSFALGKEIQV